MGLVNLDGVVIRDTYKCHKVVAAVPMGKLEFHKRSGRTMAIQDEEGYLVIYNKDTELEYVSWSPKFQFDEGYNKILNSSFSDNYSIMTFFSYNHLPKHLQDISEPFHQLALGIISKKGDYDETCVALRKLLEAKDCAVRAMLNSNNEVLKHV